MEDNWKHRSEEMRCRRCMFFVPKSTSAKNLGKDQAVVASSLGRCRRHAPTMSGFPVVFEGDWCGDHKVDENK